MRKTFSLPVAATAAGGGPTPPPADTVDNIEHSVRLNSADSAQFTKTFSSAGNTTTNTISLWVKRNKISYALATLQSFLSANNDFIWHFDTSDRLGLYKAPGGFIRYTTQKFRDPSAWYHFVFATDTTQSAASDQIKVYVNGQLITDWDTETALTQNTTLTWNSNVQHCIGSNAGNQFPDIQIADVQNIDGLQLTPSSFGFTDSNGVWQPKAYTGSYGTNGFHLDFADTSSATALGNDVSGNNNDWTPSGLVAGPAYTANSWSTEFDGTGDYLSIPNSADLRLGSDDFTIETWFRFNSGFSGVQTITGLWDSTNNERSYILYYNSGTLYFNTSTDGSTTTFVSAAQTLNANQWYHVAACRNSGAVTLYLNGTSIATGTLSSAFYNNTTGNIGIGAFNLSSTPAGFFNGKISNLRVVKGQALYTAAFTPPTVALTTTSQGATASNVKLLTCQDSTFIDNSASAHTITPVGDAATSTVSPFEPVDGSDAMLDSPTNYGSGDLVRGNYCTLNPLDNGGASVTNGNLDWDSGGNQGTRSTFFVASGKWYWELTYNESNLIGEHGVATRETQVLTGGSAFPGAFATSWGFSNTSGNKSNNASFTNIASAGTQGDVVMIALDMDNGKIWWGRNGTWFSSGDPSAGTNAAFTNLSGYTVAPMAGVGGAAAGAVSYNFGQQPFKYPAPSGYKSLCSTNLPTPAVADGSTAMDVALYTGNGSTQTISGLNFSPDLVWLKSRSNPGSGVYHTLYDSVRGQSSGFYVALFSNSTDSEDAPAGSSSPGSIYGGVSTFNNDGFTLAAGTTDQFLNVNNYPYVGWTWDAGSSTVSNTDGTITSQVRANPTAGFSVVIYTGNGSTNQTVGHGLNVKPSLVIYKDRDSTSAWRVIPTFINDGHYLALNSSAAIVPSTSYFGTNTSSVLGITGSNSGIINASGNSIVAYCFAPVEGFSSFGSYTGNGSTDGPFVYTGFKPKWILVKITSATGNWILWDTVRQTFNVNDVILLPDSNLAELVNSSYGIDVVSNGFKLKGSGPSANASAATYIYAAFAEHPFKTSRAR